MSSGQILSPLNSTSLLVPDPKVEGIERPVLFDRPETPPRNRFSSNAIDVFTHTRQHGALVNTSSEEDMAIRLIPTPATSIPSSDSSPLLQGATRIDHTVELRLPELQSSEDDDLEVNTSWNPTDFQPLRSKYITPLPLRQLVYPKSLYGGCSPPFPICKERVAVEDLRENSQLTSSDEGGYEEILLSEFSVYAVPTSPYRPFELQSLQNLSLYGHSTLMFDGILGVGESQRYVQRVPFDICSIGHYGQEYHEVGSDIWILSRTNATNEVYYRLTTSSPEYARYHTGFLWLANLAKHFVDYCHASKSPISIHDFRSDFSEWVLEAHKESTSFQSWYQEYGNCDFRHAVSRNIEFLFKESIGVNEELRSHPIWSELLVQDAGSVKKHPIKETKTIVTPYIYECFSHLRFGDHLKAVQPVTNVTIQQNGTSRAPHLSASATSNSSLHPVIRPSQLDKVPSFVSPDIRWKIESIKTGDTIAVPVDKESASKWKDEISPWKQADTCWYLLVQDINIKQNGEKSFKGIWFYQPSQTLCAKMKYPYSNEIFLSDHCNCGPENEIITEDGILDVVTIRWHGNPLTSGVELFVRQTYLENERFVDLKEDHKSCTHFKSKTLQHQPPYPIGQTVLARPLSQQNSRFELEIYEVVKYVKDLTKNRLKVTLRHLRRRSEFDAKGKPNELVYTSLEDEVYESKIYSECTVRFFDENQLIPAPYSRGGAGNLFYITQQRVVDEYGAVKLATLTKCPTSLIQGFDPYETLNQKSLLRGLDLYCGGGNFGRGLEEGGAVENCYAVDLEKAAIHTYNANLRPNSNTKLFYGSVDDLLKAAMNGNPRNIESVPLPGQVDFISAGSPCQGFSLLNTNKSNEKSKKNQSLVASVAAYVDFYRPSYGLLENVVSMAQKGKGRDEDVLSQLICALVGMGYQTQIIFRDAWSSGSPQSRSRLFVCFAAPGMEPLEHPAISHSHPPGTKQRSLGKCSNNQPFGSRNLDILTPFKFVSLGESAKDLPVIGDGMTGTCISVPDHILKETTTEPIRRQIQAIPLFPRGLNFAKAWWNEATRTISKEDRLLFPPHRDHNGKIRDCVQLNSKGWERANPDKVLSTITVAMQMHNSRGGTTIHWNENRLISLMEYRRGQTYPDEEILVGTRAQGMKIIGNSVARSVAVSFGLRLREAWLKTEPVRTRPESVGTAVSVKSNAQESPQFFRNFSKHESSITITKSSRAKNIKISDSTENSDDESNFERTPALRRALGVVLQQPESGTSTAIQPDIEERVWSLKRPGNVSHGAGVAFERVIKAAKLSSQHVTSTSSTPFKNKNEQSSSTQTIVNPPTVFCPKNIVGLLTSKPQGRVIIDLTSDSEEDGKVSVLPPPATTTYKPVNNSPFDAYAKTNNYMNYDLQRKHGPTSRP